MSKASSFLDAGNALSLWFALLTRGAFFFLAPMNTLSHTHLYIYRVPVVFPIEVRIYHDVHANQREYNTRHSEESHGYIGEIAFIYQNRPVPGIQRHHKVDRE